VSQKYITILFVTIIPEFPFWYNGSIASMIREGAFKMLEPDWNQGRPTAKKIREMWGNIQFQPSKFENEKVTDS
jgi:hypothetical protein